MSIQYSGNAQTFTFNSGASTPSSDYESALVGGLVTAGWSNNAVAASDVLTFTGNPANNSTVTLDSGGNAITYTFVSVFANTAFNVLIGVDAAHSISNLNAAINGGAGGGSLYGNGAGYHAHTTITSVASSTTITATYITGGSAGNGAAATTTGTVNATWATSTLQGGGNLLSSAITPQGLQCTVLIFTVSGSFYSPGTALKVIAGDRTRARVSLDQANGVVPTTTNWRCICSKYQFFVFVPGSGDTTIVGNGISVGVPFIPTSLQGPVISAATNASPIVCTVTGHGYTSAQTVFIVGGLGNTAINGSFTIVVIDANTFSLTGTTGNGTYTPNSAFVANTTIGNTIVEAIWATGSSSAGPVSFRNGMNPNGANVWNMVNALGGSNFTSTSAPAVFWQANAVVWYDGSYLLHEPLMGWGKSSGGTQFILGQMFDAVVLKNSTIALDQTATFDSPSHNFWTLTVDGGTGIKSSVLLATS